MYRIWLKNKNPQTNKQTKLISFQSNELYVKAQTADTEYFHHLLAVD